MSGAKVRFLSFHMLLLLALGAAILWHSIPRMFASLNALNSAEALTGLQTIGEFPSPSLLKEGINAQRLALNWQDTPELQIDYATLLLAQALRESVQGDDNAPTLREAEAALLAALNKSPVSHIAWNLLAQTHLMQDRPRDAIIAMVKSYRAVPLDLDNSLSRLSLSLPLIEAFDQDTVQIIGEEVEAMARTDIEGLAATALATYRADDVTRLLEAAGADEALVEEYVESARTVLEKSRR